MQFRRIQLIRFREFTLQHNCNTLLKIQAHLAVETNGLGHEFYPNVDPIGNVATTALDAAQNGDDDVGEPLATGTTFAPTIMPMPFIEASYVAMLTMLPCRNFGFALCVSLKVCERMCSTHMGKWWNSNCYTTLFMLNSWLILCVKRHAVYKCPLPLLLQSLSVIILSLGFRP